jgi:ADP-ribose pyrophosphatase YjhB (NUDIX family)/ribosomal protein S18 acetylase RimI-like enzyme
MEIGEVAGRMRQRCPACGHVLYHNPVPGAGVLVEMDDGIVLVKRGQPPFVGSWALPSGYVEADESVEQAALRECKEETGLDVQLLELFGVYSFPEGPVQSGIVIFYRALPVGGTLQAGDDAQDVGVFPPDALPQPLAFRTHREVLARWVEGQATKPQPQGLGVSIRPARAENEARVLEMMRLIPANADMSPDEIQSAAQRFRESLGMRVLVAEASGKVVGFLVLSFSPALSGLRALIDSIAVDPGYRRRGIGGALVEAAIQQADRRGATHLLVDTSQGDASARDFYRACGFEAGDIAPLRFR